MDKRKKPNWFLPEWRKFRGFSQERLAERAGFGSKGYISELESGERRYNEDMLKLFADALGCQPWEILSVNPSLRDQQLPAGVQRIVEEVRRVPEGERDEFIDSVQAALSRLSKKAKKTAPKKRKSA